MKKLFSIFFVLALLLPVSIQAQMLDAVKDSPEGGTIQQEANLIKGRNNAPQRYYTYNYSGSELKALSVVGNINGGGSTPVYLSQLQIIKSDASNFFDLKFLTATTPSKYYNSKLGLDPGVYSSETSTVAATIIANGLPSLWTQTSLASYASFYSSGTKYNIVSGTLYIVTGSSSNMHLTGVIVDVDGDSHDITVNSPRTFSQSYTTAQRVTATRRNLSLSGGADIFTLEYGSTHSARFDFVYNPSEAYTYADGTVGPKPGKYTAGSIKGSTPTSANIGQLVSYVTISGTQYKSAYHDNTDELNYLITDATVILMDGTDGPYIKMQSGTVNYGLVETTASVTCGTQKYPDNIVNYDYQGNKDVTMTSPKQSVLSAQRSGSQTIGSVEALRLQAVDYINMSTGVPQDHVCLDFVLDNTYYTAQYIPTGTYDVKTSGVPRVNANNVGNFSYSGNYSTTTPSNFSTLRDNGSPSWSYHWFLNSGNVKVVNPNHSNQPLYVRVDAYNSYHYSCTANLWASTYPTKRSVTVSVGTGGNGSASISCAEGYGYTNNTAGDLSHGAAGTGQYYFDGTNLTLSAPAAKPGYTWSKWTKSGSTNSLSTNRTSFAVTVASGTNYNGAFVANYTPNTNTAYTVKHYKQNLALDGYTEVMDDRQNQTGTTDESVTPAVKSYDGFNAPSTQTKTIAGDGSMVIEYYYTRNKYDVTVVKNNNTYGTLTNESDNQRVITNVPYGTVITTGTGANANQVIINGTPITATEAESTAQYTYAFDSWTNGTETVTDDMTVIANFTQTKKQYTLTWDFAGGATTSETGDYTNGLIDWGTDITAPANPTKVGFTFTGWNVTPAATMPTNDVTYTAQWESSVTPEIVLNEEGEQHKLNGVDTDKTLDDLADEYNNRDVNVTIDRTLYGGSWNTIVFPFSVEDMEGNVLDGSLYELNTSTTTATSEGMVINFEPLSGDGKIVAGVPYLIRTSADVNLNSYPFNGVRLTSEFSSVTDGDAVDFVPIKEKEKINYDAANLAIFIVGNRLYYPNKTTGTNLRGFRAYLKIKNGTVYGGPVRIRIADTGETITLDEEQEIETRKYVEDGILIIERGGVRYDAQGKRME